MNMDTRYMTNDPLLNLGYMIVISVHCGVCHVHAWYVVCVCLWGYIILLWVGVDVCGCEHVHVCVRWCMHSPFVICYHHTVQ